MATVTDIASTNSDLRSQVDELVHRDRQLRKDVARVSQARAAAPKGDEVGSALDMFPAEDALFEADPFLDTVGSDSGDDRFPADEGRRAEINDGDAGKGTKPHWLVSWLIVAILLSAIPVAFAITLLAMAVPFVFIWLVYMGLIQPFIRTEASVIVYRTRFLGGSVPSPVEIENGVTSC